MSDIKAALMADIKACMKSGEKDKLGVLRLASVEQAELDIIQTYLPAQLDDAEIDAMIDSTISDTGASEIRDMGKVMGSLKPKLQGRADMSAVSAKIKARLSA